METFATSSGEMQTYIDGELVKDIGYDVNYDGDIAEIYVKEDDEEYYTRLEPEALLQLLNSSHAKGDLMLRLKEEYPIVSTTKESKTKKEKREKREKKTRRKKNKK
jgi:hypothetical protein